MTEKKLQLINDLMNSIAVCECVLEDIQKGVWVAFKTPNTEKVLPDPLMVDFEDFLNKQILKYREQFKKM